MAGIIYSKALAVRKAARFFPNVAMLRRIAGAPIRGENYFKAEIVAGKVGAEQSTKGVEFD